MLPCISGSFSPTGWILTLLFMLNTEVQGPNPLNHNYHLSLSPPKSFSERTHNRSPAAITSTLLQPEPHQGFYWRYHRNTEYYKNIPTDIKNPAAFELNPGVLQHHLIFSLYWEIVLGNYSKLGPFDNGDLTMDLTVLSEMIQVCCLGIERRRGGRGGSEHLVFSVPVLCPLSSVLCPLSSVLTLTVTIKPAPAEQTSSLVRVSDQSAPPPPHKSDGASAPVKSSSAVRLCSCTTTHTEQGGGGERVSD